MSSKSSSEEKILTLRSKDDEIFSVKESVAVQSSTIKNMVEDDCAVDTIPLPNVDAKTLALVLEYLNKHADSTISDEEKEKFDSEFNNRPFPELLEILSAANYLDTKCLISAVTPALANLVKEMTVEEIREAFSVENDFTPDEEAQLPKDETCRTREVYLVLKRNKKFKNE